MMAPSLVDPGLTSRSQHPVFVDMSVWLFRQLSRAWINFYSAGLTATPATNPDIQLAVRTDIAAYQYPQAGRYRPYV